ncbi:Putative phosphatase [Cronobacter condimenti 1330]|uniref:Putative phosphatase n=1 Tax=Cronobacter condimenti 1330 TaxID=1073999 RepID=K8A398_9ENTR|nr:Putative phosphatase [Cronobacter condimenti 1330]
MGRPLKTLFKREHSEEISNPSDNRAFSQVAEVFLSRRRLLQAGQSQAPRRRSRFC